MFLLETFLNDPILKILTVTGLMYYPQKWNKIIFEYSNTSTKSTSIEGSLKKNEGYIYKKLLDKRKEVKPEFEINDLVKTADLKKTSSKSGMTNWSYLLSKIRKLKMIQNQVIKLTVYQSVITRSC